MLRKLSVLSVCCFGGLHSSQFARLFSLAKKSPLSRYTDAKAPVKSRPFQCIVSMTAYVNAAAGFAARIWGLSQQKYPENVEQDSDFVFAPAYNVLLPISIFCICDSFFS